MAEPMTYRRCRAALQQHQRFIIGGMMKHIKKKHVK
ncbi:MAG: hypothetical protein GPOALKHO_000800 [Sodalis sp.]|nr:MAG: hypothetical protein GPOALKHO_000800 [Sodalis sp.]